MKDVLNLDLSLKKVYLFDFFLYKNLKNKFTIHYSNKK